MTFDDCRAALAAIRRKQGTRSPILRVDYGGAVFRGRLVRCDSDPEHAGAVKPPYGLLVLEDLGLGRRPEMILQIADLVPGAIREAEDQAGTAA